MPQHLNGNVHCPNPKCEKIVVKIVPRWMEECPNNVTPYHRWQRKTMIGRSYFHEDGTLCDQALYTMKKLAVPVFLHLGDSTRDPRN